VFGKFLLPGAFFTQNALKMFGRHAGKLTALPQTSLLYLSRLLCGCVGRNEQEEGERRSHPLPPVHGSATILASYGAVSLPSESSGG